MAAHNVATGKVVGRLLWVFWVPSDRIQAVVNSTVIIVSARCGAALAASGV